MDIETAFEDMAEHSPLHGRRRLQQVPDPRPALVDAAQRQRDVELVQRHRRVGRPRPPLRLALPQPPQRARSWSPPAHATSSRPASSSDKPPGPPPGPSLRCPVRPARRSRATRRQRVPHGQVGGGPAPPVASTTSHASSRNAAASARARATLPAQVGVGEDEHQAADRGAGGGRPGRRSRPRASLRTHTSGPSWSSPVLSLGRPRRSSSTEPSARTTWRPRSSWRVVP